MLLFTLPYVKLAAHIFRKPSCCQSLSIILYLAPGTSESLFLVTKHRSIVIKKPLYLHWP